MNETQERGKGTAALVLAAGRGTRAGGGLPKQYRLLGGKPVLRWSVETFLRHPAIDRVHVVVSPGEEEMARAALGPVAERVTTGHGGASRQQSVFAGLRFLAASPPAYVLVHDAARPFLPPDVIDRVLAALAEYRGASPALPVADSLRRGGTLMEADVSRQNLWRIQTPQGFSFSTLLAAHQAAASCDEEATDDAMLLVSRNIPVCMVEGDGSMEKITTAADLQRLEAMLGHETVTGQGFDVHRLQPGDGLWLCGVRVPHDRTLLGHSDADVALHALTDALLGALGTGDIGSHFPPSDPQWKGASSDRFLQYAAQKVAEAGGRIVHCDITILAEAPKIGPYRAAMLARLAEILKSDAPRLSIKATTTEGLGLVGRREGIAAMAVATVALPKQGGAANVR